ncbi:hypothetical protein D3C73_916580 [compost metagenome]
MQDHAHRIAAVVAALAQRRGGHHHGVLGFAQHDEHLRRHRDAQLFVGVGHVEQAVVVHGGGGGAAAGRGHRRGGVVFLDGVRRGFHRAQGGVIALVGFAQDGEVHRQPRLDPGDVGFRNLRLDRHGVHLGHLDDGGRALDRVDGLAFLGHHRHHHAVDRRNNACVPQVDLGRVHLDFGLRDLGVQRRDLGTGHAQRGFGGLIGFARTGVGRQHLALALERQLSLFQHGDLGGPLGAPGLQGGFGVAQVVLLGQVVDLGNQLAFLDPVAQFHFQGLQLAGGLGAHADALDGVDGAAGQHAVFQIGPSHFRHRESGRRRRREEHGAQAQHPQEDDDGDDCVTFELTAGLFHCTRE